MSYFPNATGEMPTGIKGTALIGSNQVSSDLNFLQFTYPSGGTYVVKHIGCFNALKYTTNDITGNFDAIDNDGTSLSSVSSSGMAAYKLNQNTKVLIIGYYPTTGLSSTTNTRGKLSISQTILLSGSASSYEKEDQLDQYFAPNYTVGGVNQYSDALINDLNSSEIGQYFKLAGIDRLDDNLFYAFMENGTYDRAYLAWRKNGHTGSPGNVHADTSATNNHFLYIIQFN